MLVKIFSAALNGVDAYNIIIEVSLNGKGSGYQITGLPDDAIKESLNRIYVAISSLGYQMPRTRLNINLAPAHIKKYGTAYDLAMAVGILVASEQLVDLVKLKDYLIVGEIGLDGTVYAVKGALNMAICAKREGFKGVMLPHVNTREAFLVKDLEVYGISHLKDIIHLLKSEKKLQPRQLANIQNSKIYNYPDFAEVKGQQGIKRALEIAAAGSHNCLIIGSPGIGKSMLAKRLPGILPPMTDSESLETTKIYSVANCTEPVNGLITERPFRSPHHTISDAGLVGGGSFPTPGEISLAHNGVLFLDELAEFRRSSIEVLRQPLEDRKVLIARARISLEFPAAFMLIAAMNPCPCGYAGHPTKNCTCSKKSILWYRRKISGPLLDRIDIQAEADPSPFKDQIGINEISESSSSIRKRVIKARVQKNRFQNEVFSNSQISESDLKLYCVPEEHANKFLLKSMERYDLSYRAYNRILKVARTIADLALSQQIEIQHIAEAIHFRSLDKLPPVNQSSQEKNKKHRYDFPDFSN